MSDRYAERECWHGHDWWPIDSRSAEEEQCSICGTVRLVGDRSRCMIYANERG